MIYKMCMPIWLGWWCLLYVVHCMSVIFCLSLYVNHCLSVHYIIDSMWFMNPGGPWDSMTLLPVDGITFSDFMIWCMCQYIMTLWYYVMTFGISYIYNHRGIQDSLICVVHVDCKAQDTHRTHHSRYEFMYDFMYANSWIIQLKRQVKFPLARVAGLPGALLHYQSSTIMKVQTRLPVIV